MAKDRAAPFSRKHRRYWLTITGGMILIGALNIGIGYCAYPGAAVLSRTPGRIIPVLPQLHRDAAPSAGLGPDAAPTAPLAPDAAAR